MTGGRKGAIKEKIKHAKRKKKLKFKKAYRVVFHPGFFEDLKKLIAEEKI